MGKRVEIDKKGEKVLILPIRKKWLDMILSGEKGEEYSFVQEPCFIQMV